MAHAPATALAGTTRFDGGHGAAPVFRSAGAAQPAAHGRQHRARYGGFHRGVDLHRDAAAGSDLAFLRTRLRTGQPRTCRSLVVDRGCDRFLGVGRRVGGGTVLSRRSVAKDVCPVGQACRLDQRSAVRGLQPVSPVDGPVSFSPSPGHRPAGPPIPKQPGGARCAECGRPGLVGAAAVLQHHVLCAATERAAGPPAHPPESWAGGVGLAAPATGTPARL